jgi:hypothetical protein
VRDPYSGVVRRAVRVKFGDGTSGRGRARFVHRFSRAGTYRITALVRDRVGNRAVVRQWVSVR